ncbi:MAG: hypothetical protein WC794_02930 [Candidatus Doudnabacteria bacterium]
MKKSPAKTPKKAKNLEEKVDFLKKIQRMEAWIKKVSLKVGIPYEF